MRRFLSINAKALFLIENKNELRQLSFPISAFKGGFLNSSKLIGKTCQVIRNFKKTYKLGKTSKIIGKENKFASLLLKSLLKKLKTQSLSEKRYTLAWMTDLFGNVREFSKKKNSRKNLKLFPTCNH